MDVTITGVGVVTLNAAPVTPVLSATPCGVATVKVLGPAAAPFAIFMSTSTVVAAPPVMSVVMPEPLKLTAVAPARLVPVMVALTVVPSCALLGVMLVTVATTGDAPTRDARSLASWRLP